MTNTTMTDARYAEILDAMCGASQHTDGAKALRMGLSDEERAEYSARRDEEHKAVRAAKGAKQGQRIARARDKARKDLAALTKAIGEETIAAYGTGDER